VCVCVRVCEPMRVCVCVGVCVRACVRFAPPPQAVTAHPEVPIGMQGTSWGGVAIQVWMSPAAMAECPHAAQPLTLEEQLATGTTTGATPIERGMGIHAAGELGFLGSTAGPSKPSCLYNSMLYVSLSACSCGAAPSAQQPKRHQQAFSRVPTRSS
jgi:hypothetical protein